MKYRFVYLLLLVGSLHSLSLSAQQAWKRVTSIEDLSQFDPEILPGLFKKLNLDYPGLEAVKMAYKSGDLNEASALLLEYYEGNSTAENYRRVIPDHSDQTVPEADTILKDVYTIQNIKGQVPTLENGHRDWYYKGPNNDREWAWLSNRHSQMNLVLGAYFKTGNPIYIKYIDLFLRDFILASMPYPAKKGSESIWRGLEVAARAKSWTRLFYSTISDPYISPATRILILSSLADHAHYNRNFHGQNNWLTMEVSALATVAAYFPEYKQADAWMEYTIGTMTESMKQQVYPDGIQTELTSHYHNVALYNFVLFQALCKVANKPLPDFYIHTLESMYDYISHAVRPTGERILNNDGDKGSDKSIVMDGVNAFDHEDWEYIITNGVSGTKPTDGPSYFYPWAGQMISRSGFDENAHWSFFDIGPYGSGHQHNDKMHVSVVAYGKDLLVDAGRFAYTGAVAEKFRPYAKSSAAHNTVLIDGNGQNRGPLLAQKPLADQYYKILDHYDYASGSFNDYLNTEGKAKHIRSLFYVRGDFWIVVDRIDTDRSREISTLWHWHPDLKVETSKNITRTKSPSGNLAIIPVGKQKFKITSSSGQEEPMQGWYSPEYNVYGPNIATSYQNLINKSSNQVWILYPYEKELPKVKAKIISSDETGIRIKVKTENEFWDVAVPFLDSSKAQLIKQ